MKPSDTDSQPFTLHLPFSLKRCSHTSLEMLLLHLLHQCLDFQLMEWFLLSLLAAEMNL